MPVRSPLRALTFKLLVISGVCLLLAATDGLADTTEFCLEGEFDLGARYQGMAPETGEFYDTRFCVITEDDGGRVRFHGTGRSNPDMEGDFKVAYLPPDRVRIVNGVESPDLDFVGTHSSAEARRHRRIDPQRLADELEAHSEWLGAGDRTGFRAVAYPGEERAVSVRLEDGRLRELRTRMPVPLRGVVPVRWLWDWSEPARPGVRLIVDDEVLFRGRGRWRSLDEQEAAAVWEPAGPKPPRDIPGENWPSRVAMRLEELGEGVYRVRGVRTGFHHLVVDSPEGLIVADAPAGWAELHQIPPADIVGLLGVSGLSERLIEFLHVELDRPIHAVVLTHAHDDHAGGARAFAAAGATVYAPASVADFLQAALNRAGMPDDALSAKGGRVEVKPVSDRTELGGGVEIIPIGRSPHVSDSIGLLVAEADLFFQSDLHVPGSDGPAPSARRAASECWFAEWALDRLPAGTRVINSHSLVATPRSRFESYLNSETCRTSE